MSYKINLMPKKDAPLVDRIMYFALNYLRYIIVITQLVVIGVFFYRFQVDQKIIDLKESVEQKKEIVNIVLPLLNEAARIDSKNKEITRIIQGQEQYKEMMAYLTSVFPETAKLSSLEIKSDSIKINGLSTDPRHLQAFYNLLKKDKKFTNIEFQSIKKVDTSYEFIIALNNYGKK